MVTDPVPTLASTWAYMTEDQREQVRTFIAAAKKARAGKKVCANDNCRKVFDLQEGRDGRQGRRTTGVLYCTPLCARAQAERNRRARKKI